MIEIGENLVVGFGNEPAGSNGALIARVAPDGSLTAEHVLDEQGCFDMHLHNGKLYVAGADPTDDWTLGNLYIRAVEGTWVKRRTLPLTIHTWGLCHDVMGNLFAAVGAHTGDNVTWEGRVMRSTDDGLTWSQNVKVNDYRIYDIIQFGDRLYAIGYNWTGSQYQQQLWWSDNSGATWNLEVGREPHILQRMVIFDARLLLLHKNQVQLLIIDSNFTAVSRNTPSLAKYLVMNSLVVNNDKLYFLDNFDYIWRTSDLEAWERYSYVPNAISIGVWPSQNCLVVSDIGVNARLWKVNL